MKRSIYQRLAEKITLEPDGLPWDADVLESLCSSVPPVEYTAPHWIWHGRLTAPKLRAHQRVIRRGGRLYHITELVRPRPIIQLDGQKHFVVRLLYHLVLHAPITTKTRVLRDLRACANHLCVNPHHHVQRHPKNEPQMPPQDDVEELTLLLREKYDCDLRAYSLEELRAKVSPDFSLEDYAQALQRSPELKDWQALLNALGE